MFVPFDCGCVNDLSEGPTSILTIILLVCCTAGIQLYGSRDAIPRRVLRQKIDVIGGHDFSKVSKDTRTAVLVLCHAATFFNMTPSVRVF